MNTQRLIVLGFALVAAGGAAFLVRGLLGGGTPQVEARPAPVMPMSEVLVANTALTPGQALAADQVRWEKWPTASVDSSFITHNTVGSIDEAVKGTVVRASILQGQPIAANAIVHGDASGFLAATLSPGMRAVSIDISAQSSAGGFVLPNDRVDVILTRKFEGSPPRVQAKTILSNLRVMAVDQTFKQEKDTRTVVGKTATVEVSPEQAEIIAMSASAGQLSLSLRPLGDNVEVAALDPRHRKRNQDNNGPVQVFRYGLTGQRQQQESAQ